MTTEKTFCKLALVAATAAFAAFVHATDMDHKGRVIATVATKSAGSAEVTCNDPGGWKFDVSASQDSGRDVVTVRMSSPTNAQPPQFGVFFRVPGAGVQNVWTADFQRDGFHVGPQLWWGWTSKYKSQLARDTPIAVGFNAQERAPVALACTEAFNALEFGLYADDRTCEMVGRCEFFTAPVAPLREYEASVMLDRRGGDFAETVRQCTEWIARKNGFRTADVPEAAFDPLYSTWYAYLQDVHAGELEEEARLAAAIGMKTMILDDGWQKVESRTFYSATGDWMPVPSRFPDMKAHVAAVHKAGLKYMLWLAVPYIGDESKAWSRFKDKVLTVNGTSSPGKVAVLDPRFPAVREYLISTYERVVGEWGFDGVKLDFIDSFVLPKNDPAAKDNYAGRDYRSLPDAVDRLMKDVLARLKKINPDVLVEFRQHYMGPAILQYGNMMRAADCPADPTANRKRMCDLRLTSRGVAVHSDMLVWSMDETPEGAALPILNVLFSTIQYSMVLAKVSPAHREVIRSWLEFSQRHRNALLRGAFRPHHAENGYTWIEGESEGERVVAAYANDVCVRTGAADRTVFLVNATGGRGMLAEFAADARVEFFDVFGKPAGNASVSKGLVRLAVPASGFAKVAWLRSDAMGADPIVHDPTARAFYLGEPKQTVAEVQYPERVFTNAEGRICADFGKDAFGWLEIDAPAAGLDYFLALGESLLENGTLDRSCPRCVRCLGVKWHTEKAGFQRLPVPPDLRNLFAAKEGAAIKIPEKFGIIMPFRAVEIYECAFPVDKATIRRRVVTYPADRSESAFSCDDKRLNAVWDFCRHSMFATSFAGQFVDGDRERIPYEADSFVSQLNWYAISSDYAYPRKSIEYLYNHPTWPTEFRQISILSAWADWMWTGDPGSIERNYDLLKGEKLLLGWRRADGLLRTGGERRPHPHLTNELGLADIVDWPKAERDGFEFREVNAVVNAFHYRDLLAMADIAEAIGRGSDAETFRAQARETYDAFQRTFFDSGRGLYLDGEGASHVSIHANALALAFDLVPEGRIGKVADWLESRGMACSVYFSQYLLAALFKAGRDAAALRLLTGDDNRSWIGMMKQGATITMEAWNVEVKPNLDWNHAWGAVPLNIVSRFLLGVTPMEPGFKKIAICPRLGGLKRVSAVVPTAAGSVVLNVSPSELEFTSPSPAEVTFAGETRLFPAGRHRVGLQIRTGAGDFGIIRGNEISRWNFRNQESGIDASAPRSLDAWIDGAGRQHPDARGYDVRAGVRSYRERQAAARSGGRAKSRTRRRFAHGYCRKIQTR